MNAFMIMCHKNAHQVIRLAGKCVTKNTDVIIHADNLMDDAEYQLLTNFAAAKKGVYLTERRLHGTLDTRSLVDIAIEMVNCAKNIEDSENKHYKYYALLSGQDYLIKPMHWIEKQLEQLYPKPLIDCTPYSKSNWIYYKFRQSFIDKKYSEWIKNNLKKHAVIRKPFRLSEMFLRKLGELCKRDCYSELQKENIALYGGSAWWILPDIVMSFILDELKKNTYYIYLLLEQSNTPEETFFQILTMRSPVADQVDVNPEDMVAQNCKTWAYFSDDGKPFKGHPYIFTAHEFDKLRNSECWIARKFDETEDKSILDLLDQQVLEAIL